jgi:hypothetical protein
MDQRSSECVQGCSYPPNFISNWHSRSRPLSTSGDVQFQNLLGLTGVTVPNVTFTRQRQCPGHSRKIYSVLDQEDDIPQMDSIDRQSILTSRAKCTTLQEGSKALVTGISSIRTTLGSHYAIYIEPTVVRAQPTEQSQLAFPNPRGAWTWLCS